jgi:hypothetical protein
MRSPSCREVVDDGHRVILKKSYQDAFEEKTAMTVDLNSIDLVSPPNRDEAETSFRLAQWTGTATSSTASASGTTIGFGRR